tara:strand:- start:113874 stop:114671 length:798 start_codon:yes stop_codon:yes gene_type:complete
LVRANRNFIEEIGMSTRKVIFGTSLLSAAIVLGVAVPLSYLGLQSINKKMQAQQAAVKSVVLDLKVEALKEIKAANENAGMANSKARAEETQAMTSELAALSQSIRDLRETQQSLAAKIEQGATTNTASAAQAMPGTREDALNQTIFFPLGKIEGPEIDKQINDMLPKIADYSQGRPCVANVLGFSDTLGGDKSNLELSQRRAVHVAALLKRKNIDVNNVKGWGERWLNEHTVDGVKNQKNRRVVIETLCHTEMPKTAAGQKPSS